MNWYLSMKEEGNKKITTMEANDASLIIQKGRKEN